MPNTAPYPGYSPAISDEDWEANQRAALAHVPGIAALAPNGIPWQQWRQSQKVEDHRGITPTKDKDTGRMLLDGTVINDDGRVWLPPGGQAPQPQQDDPQQAEQDATQAIKKVGLDTYDPTQGGGPETETSSNAGPQGFRGSPDTSGIQDQIRSYAQQHGIDPAWALAVADRESSFNPHAHASKTIDGLFQMSGPVRAQYGVPTGADVQTQVKGFADYANGLRQDMASRIGRDPTPSELYLGHYWGPARAAGVITGHYSGLTAKDVFTPRELAENPNLKPDKPVGEIAGSITRDMDRRYAKFGGHGGTTAVASNDFDRSAYGVPIGDTAGDTTTAAADGADAKSPASTDNPTVKTAMSPDDLSQTPPASDVTETSRKRNSGAPEPKMASISPPSAPLSLTPSVPSLPSAPSADDQAMTTAALNDTGGAGLGDYGDALADLGKAMSSSGTQQAQSAPSSLKLNLGNDTLQQLALAQEINTPVSGMPSIPGQGKGGSFLPGQNQQAPSYLDPRMFGIQPTQQG